MRQTFRIENEGIIKGGLVKINRSGNVVYWSVSITLKLGIFAKTIEQHGQTEIDAEVFQSHNYDEVGDHYHIGAMVIETTSRENNMVYAGFSLAGHDITGRAVIDVSNTEIFISKATIYAAVYGVFAVIKVEAAP